MQPNEERNSNSGQIMGVGLSARPPYYESLLRKQQFPWLEFLADNYFYAGSPRRQKLEKLSALYPLVFHCVGFNLGSTDSLNVSYLNKIKLLVDEFQPKWVSDHLCFCGHGEHYTPDLLPIPYTETLLKHVKDKIKKIVQTLQIPFLVENLSYYIKFEESDFTEEEFLGELSEVPGCFILLDVNNLYVNSKNYDFCPVAALERLPPEKIRQIHLAGHQDYKTHLVDTHGENIQSPVLELFGKVIKKLGKIPVTIERDNNIPPFEDILLERNRIIEAGYG